MLTLPEKKLQNYLLGGIGYSAIHWKKVPHAIERGLNWYRPLAGQGHYHLPFFLVMDLGLLLEYGFETPFASEQEYQQWPEAQRAPRLRYENELLGRLLQEPNVQSILEFLQLHKDRQQRIQRLLELLMRSIAPHYPREVLVNPAHLRNFRPQAIQLSDIAEHQVQFEAFIEREDYFMSTLTQFLDNVSKHVRWSEILREEDIFEIEHWDVLNTEDLRIGCRQILEIERMLGEIDARQIAIADEGADVETAFVDETHYPTGGLSELTNRGSFENLVLSELVYIEDGPEVDLFEVRFVENELLYYLRDSGQLRRKRRSIHLIIDLDTTFQLKSSGYDYQFSILAQGFLLRIARDLFKVFEHDAVQFHFHYVTGEQDTEAIEREIEIMRLLLADEVQHGWVTLDISKELDLASLKESKRKVYAVTFSAARGQWWQKRFHETLHEHPAILGIPIQIKHKKDKETKANTPTFQLPIEGLPFQDIVELKNKVIAELAGLRSS
ncbi:MAG TPA: hypothetical protein DCE42_12435 [Myxococcales bacterium]|nr:hypothetical protein [Deltaproteobacteria bacterium]MBU54071.1 hypothetical protein [Deltaproteobacteria bacterium]HAA55560.1 hypothetical protein [Myxococcales bacterium]|tara:strand:- start:7792 stop:9282 length:1491 start_codon:yes stop_codon:yes gene_type:complete